MMNDDSHIHIIFSIIRRCHQSHEHKQVVIQFLNGLMIVKYTKVILFNFMKLSNEFDAFIYHWYTQYHKRCKTN